MIKLERNNKNVIDIKNLKVNIEELYPNSGNYKFVHNGETFFFKLCGDDEIFNEILADEIATHLGLPHASYDIGIDEECNGALSTSIYKDNEEFLTINEIVSKLKLKSNKVLCAEYIKRYILPRICLFRTEEEYIKYLSLFAFDILIGNDDRNASNVGFIKKKNKYTLAPIFDNGHLGCDGAIYEHAYYQGIGMKNYKTANEDIVLEFIKNKYGYILVDYFDKLSIDYIYGLIKKINEEYKYPFDKDHETYTLDCLNDNFKVIDYFKNEFYDESKKLRR